MGECCQASYDSLFDLKKAKQDLADYLRDGPKPTSIHLIEALKQENLAGATLLDIGGGIGSIPRELTGAGVSEVQYIDISPAYASIFAQTTATWPNVRSRIVVGDFVQKRADLQEADIVTLDKVICCYHDYRQLLHHSLDKARKYYGCILPRHIWWAKALFAVDHWMRLLRGIHFRAYIHPVSEVESLITSRGFVNVLRVHHREWITLLYRRASEAPAS